MLKIRRAKENDTGDIKRILDELDLIYSGLDLTYSTQALNNFWVALKGKRLIGVSELKELNKYSFICSVGVTKSERKRGVASNLINKMLKGVKKDVYLYTVIPEFFKKSGFKATSLKVGLPSKKMFNCEGCTPERCVTMVKSKS